MGKRSSGEGTIVRRGDGRWAGAITMPGGERKWRYGQTQAEVARKIAQLRRDRDSGLPVVAERRTVASYLDSWLQMVKPGIKASTYRSYEYVTRVHIVPCLGRQHLVKLTPELVQRWLAQKQSEGTLSTATVRYFHTVLHVALEEAVSLGLLQRNVASGLRKPRRRRLEMKWWTREQARSVLSAARESRHYAFFVLALSTGMREGELFGLRWRDLDLERRSLRVQMQLQWVKTAAGRVMSIEEVKTDSSRRHIRISAAAVSALREHRSRQRAERLTLGPIWRDHDLVFCTPIGGGLDSGNFRRDAFLPVIKRAGVPYIRPHDMRHTAATLAILDGMPIKAVSEMLGHSSVAITMTIYAHVLPDSHAQVADAMERLLFASTEG